MDLLVAPELCQRLELAAALAALEEGPLARVTLQVAVERVRPEIINCCYFTLTIYC